MKQRKESPPVQELDVTALIDIVIILISFFIFFNNAADAETNERLKLPDSAIAMPSERLPAEPFTIQIMENGMVTFNLTDYTPEKFIPVLDFECRLYKARNVPLKTVTVLIRGDARCESGKIIDIVKECQKRGLSTFKFISKVEKG